MEQNDRLRQAFLIWLGHIMSGQYGVFWVSENGEFTASYGSVVLTDVDRKPHFFWTDFLGTSYNAVTFENLYHNAMPPGALYPYKDIPALEITAPIERYSNETKNTFCDKVERIIKAAIDGNIWVANLAHILTGTIVNEVSILRFYADFLERNMPHIGGVVWTPDTKFASTSPELFLEQRGNTLITKPIKGTGTQEYLETSGKELSELSMVTDLLRNDLGIISKKVVVTTERAITPRGNFFHAHAEIIAEQDQPILSTASYKQLLPAGSISGAPKAKAISLISELESAPRGLYCGTFGFRKNQIEMQSSVLIRTLFVQGNVWQYGVGGGITYESNPLEEWKETLQKAQILQSNEL